jgi:vacuolar protein sorting-associated protein 33A
LKQRPVTKQVWKKKVGANSNKVSREIDAVILMDRTVDLLTPFVTQLSYQGLIDEFLDIEINKISIDKSIPYPTDDQGQPTQPGDKINFYLTDLIFNSIKDLVWQESSKYLSNEFRTFGTYKASRKDAVPSNVEELRKDMETLDRYKKATSNFYILDHINKFVTRGTKAKLRQIEQVRKSVEIGLLARD